MSALDGPMAPMSTTPAILTALRTHLQEKTAIYPAIEAPRRVVGKADNEPSAAAAAWHAPRST